MGLTSGSTGKGAVDRGMILRKNSPEDRVIALAGNPNVGKSTVFNALTGMNQHTGNWPGKTVTNAQGAYEWEGKRYILVDLPGTYSLMAHSREEETARDFLCFGGADAAVVVCDATCLERNLNLALQTIEIMPRTVLCINLMDEAQKKGIALNCKELEKQLGVPVVPVTARSGEGLEKLMDKIAESVHREKSGGSRVPYGEPLQSAVKVVEPAVWKYLKGTSLNPFWVSLKLLEGEKTLLRTMASFLGYSIEEKPEVVCALEKARVKIRESGFPLEHVGDIAVRKTILQAERISRKTVTATENSGEERDRKLDRILTGKWTGIPVMIALLALIFWLTITGANYPSQLLSQLFGWGEIKIHQIMENAGAPAWLDGALVSGMYNVLTRVISVMLPPMAIFFPLFTLLEDFGYLPRVAFNLDKYFKSCSACGKQALTMSMGFGCNSAGIVGCRIIDSPRERLIAILTNNFVPCNGRFPTLIAIISMFFVTSAGMGQSLLSALLLTGVILLGIWMTFLTSKLLSKTLLKGEPSSFTLELPPYRRPQIGKVLIRSIFDRTLFVLGRAAAVAAPAGLIIWLLANLYIGDQSLLSHCAGFLDPIGRLMGMDGVILLAFLLGFPANEIVVPIMIMAYLAQGSLPDMENLTELHLLLTENGWTWVTALCTMLFSLMHWPCSTACLTIYKETRSLKWSVVAILLPTLCGMILCFLVATVGRYF